MSHSAFAANHAVWTSFVLAILFCWMKGWQAIYGQRLYAVRQGIEQQSVSFSEFLRICCRQMATQPWGIFLFLLCFPLMMLPFPWVNAYFQNHTVMGAQLKGRELQKSSLELAKKEKWQNYVLIWILSPWCLFQVLFLSFGLAALLSHFSGALGLNLETLGDIPWFFIGILIIIFGIWPACPLGLIVAANILLLLMAVPYLLNTLFGIETVMLRSGYFWIANTTTLVTVSSGVYLLLDPLLKSAYSLRCFYGRSLQSGTDLLADLRPYAKKVILLLFVVAGIIASPPAMAEPGAEAPFILTEQELDQAIQEVLQQPHFAWRLPKDHLQEIAPDISLGILGRFFAPVGRFFADIGTWLGQISKGARFWLSEQIKFMFDWIEKLFGGDRERKDPESFDFADISKTLVIFLLVGVLLLLLLFLFKTFRRQRPVMEIIAEPLQTTIPDLNSEDTTADQLPEEQWLTLANEMLEKKEFRLALRALYLSTLAFLESQRLIVLKPFKSNRDYLLEIGRSSHATGELLPPFAENIKLFERSWYGNHQPGNAGMTRFQENSVLMRSCCE